MKINPLYLLTLLACGCLSDAATFPSRPVEFIELDRHPTPEVERSSPAPSGASQPVEIEYYSASWCINCPAHEAYLNKTGWKGRGYVVKKQDGDTLPDYVPYVPYYRWIIDGKKWSPSEPIRPEQLQGCFDQTPKAGK